MRFAWVTNIPTPYRNHCFERMAAILPEYGIDFVVYFMARALAQRPWRFRDDELRYPHRFFSGPAPSISGVVLHLNPGLLGELAVHPPDVVMVGGWASPSHVLAPFFSSGRTLKILGCESNLESSTRTGLLSRLAKREIVRAYDAYLVPQQRSLALLEHLEPATRERPVIRFPNLINRELFVSGVDAARAAREETRARYGVKPNVRFWLCPARLAPEKGLREFLPQLASIETVQLVVAGEGPLRAELEQLIASKHLPVSLIGNVKEAEMVRLYAAADVFVLPSFGDPSPLATIEASAAGLPLLLSRRVGNCDDVLVPGENGWSFDPSSPPSTREAVERAAAASPEALRAMGATSRARYDESFDTDRCIRELAEQLLLVWEHAKRPAAQPSLFRR